MARLNYFIHDGVTVDFIKPGRVRDDENTFTVIVGKNGVGKSRLLADIAKSETFEFGYEPDRDSSYNIGYTRTEYDQHAKVIALSTSPFDKFPNPRNRRSNVEIVTNYRYVGMRSEGMYQISSAVSLISSAAKGLIDKLLARASNHNLLAVFDSLNFLPIIDFIFKPGYIKSDRDYYNLEKISDFELAADLRMLEGEHGIQVDSRYLSLLESLPVWKRHQVFDAMIKINMVLTHRKAIELTVDFSEDITLLGGLLTDDTFIEAMLVLMNAGLMRLMDLRLQKINYGEMSLKRASSGEQCLLVLMLGIAGHITDGSLILIDEPEISLHPRWQEEFMLLLTNSFSAYRSCQFIVATHSPQIIARLKERGCFITSLSKRIVYDAEDFYQRSADYQLAELFDAPGMMNEYISRLAFNLLAKVKANRFVDSESAQELERLKELDYQVEKADPVKELISSVVELCEKYANS